MADANRHWRFKTAAGALLVAVTVVTYWPVLQCTFVNLDDQKYARENPEVADGISLHGLAYAWTTFDLGNWIPMTWMSFQLDAALFGVDARVFHAGNLFWHAANVLLLYVVLCRMTGAAGCSAAVALLFAVHPLHVESVAWISERKDVLSTAGLLLTLLVYEWYARRPSGGRLVAVCIAMALGLLAKPMLVTLPLLLLLLDLWPLGRNAGTRERRESDVGIDSACTPLTPAGEADVSGNQTTHETVYPPRTWRQLVIEKMPLFALSLVDGLITIAAQRSDNAMTGTDAIPFLLRALNAIRGYGWYLWKTVCPTGLCAFYPLGPAEEAWPFIGLSALALIAVTATVIIGRDRGYRVVGWLWFLVALLPVCGLLQVGGQAYADRYAYIPHIGLFIAIVWEAWHRLAKRAAAKWLGPACVISIAVPCALLTRMQIATWRDSETLWARCLALDPDNFAAHAGLGILHMQEQNFEAAEPHLRRVLDQRPAFRGVLDHLAKIHEEREEWTQAAEYYAWELRVNPHDVEATAGLAALRDSGRLVAETRPERPTANGPALEQNRLGLSLARQGKMEAALRHFREAVAIDANYADAHNNAGLALKELNRLDEAKRSVKRALAYAPDNADFHVNLASICAAEGAWDEARDEYKAALRLRPQDVDVKFRLEQLKKKAGPR